jgi:uncharacterized protein YbbK (DUF523 family)
MKIVSACLAGINCAYDGQNRSCEKVIEMVRNHEAIPVCPEQLGGLPTPRVPAEIQQGKVINQNGEDVTEHFVRGAKEAVSIAKLANCQKAILKTHSPSCGFGIIYDGTFNHVKVKGNGIFADLLLKEGVDLMTEKEI